MERDPFPEPIKSRPRSLSEDFLTPFQYGGLAITAGVLCLVGALVAALLDEIDFASVLTGLGAIFLIAGAFLKRRRD